MSDWVADTSAANSAVVAPTAAMMPMATGDSTSSGPIRISRNGPAFTIVAA